MRYRMLLAGCAGLALVGFSRGAPSAWLAMGATGFSGALFCVLVLRSSELSPRRLGEVGGPPFFGAGALASLGMGLGLLELYFSTTLRWSTSWVAGPVAVLASVLTAVAALRVSTAVESKRTLYALALVALLSAAVATLLFTRSYPALPPLPGGG